MKDINHSILNKAKKKIFPALGGISRNYLKKSECLKKILILLSEKLKKVGELEGVGLNAKKIIQKIGDDILTISKYGKTSKVSFYINCISIMNSY
jgi:hypothetical protein